MQLNQEVSAGIVEKQKSKKGNVKTGDSANMVWKQKAN
jgi:hypothetical protein